MKKLADNSGADLTPNSQLLSWKVVSLAILLMLVTSLLALGAFYWFEEDDSDVVKVNPPNESELQPGRVFSDENIYMNEDDTGNFRTHCKESHVSNDDPLLYPGQTGAAHEHVFFGFPKADAFTTIDALENATEPSTCEGGALNQSAYWVPSLFTADGTRLEFIEPLFYYKSGYHLPPDIIEAPPKGLVMIAGKEMSEPQDVVSAKFRCESWEAPLPQFDEGDPMDHVPYLPECDPGDLLEFRVVFPQCWDGVNLTSEDQRSHMSYPILAEAPNTGTGRCPDSHPVAIPEISYKFAVDVTSSTGSSNTWYLSSDIDQSRPNGSSLHADWMNGWDTDIMDLIVKNCIKSGYDCSVGLLGDGTRLEEVYDVMEETFNEVLDNEEEELDEEDETEHEEDDIDEFKEWQGEIIEEKDELLEEARELGIKDEIKPLLDIITTTKDEEEFFDAIEKMEEIFDEAWDKEDDED